MTYMIRIRESVPADAPHISDLIRSAYLSNVNSAWCNALFKEITFQLIVMMAAVMFIFLGVPLSYCLCAVPLVMLLIYLIVYASFFTKAIELVSAKRPVMCWVAEAYLPYFFTKEPRDCLFQILQESHNLDLSQYQKKIIGTVAVMNNLHLPYSAWLFRLAVDRSFRKKGVARSLVAVVQNYCRKNGYMDVQVAVSECQEDARRIFTDCGLLRLMYHKQLIGTALTLLMYHLECSLEPDL